MEVNKTGQNCEEKADRQIIEKNEQRSVNDSNCWSTLRSGFLRKASSHFLPDPLWRRHLPSGSTRHRGGVNICDTGNFFHLPQDSREVVFIMVCQLI